MRSTWFRVLVATWIVAAFAAGAGFAIARQPHEPSVDELLARVNRFTTAAKTYRMEGTGAIHSVLGYSEDGDRSFLLTRIRSTIGAGRERWLTTSGAGAVESIRVGPEVVYRKAATSDELAGLRWWPGGTDGAVVFFGGGSAPTSFFDGNVARYAQAPSVVRHDHGRPVIRFSTPPELIGKRTSRA